MMHLPALLDESFGLPLDRPFHLAEALEAGLGRERLCGLVRSGHVRRVLRGVYVVAQVADSPAVRAAAIGLVVPRGYTVTDESAGWLCGARMILAPGAHRTAPPVSVFAERRGYRLRNGLSTSGSRGLLPEDVTHVHGIPVTTPVRTALDLGRLRHRDRALAAMDQLLRVARLQPTALLEQVGRFVGFRGVRQLRWLAPLADGRSESPGESILRLRALQAGVPRPTPQVEIFDDDGRFLGRGDLVVEELRLILEYDGEHWHGPERAVQDRERRRRIEEAGWIVKTFRRNDILGPRQNAEERLAQAVEEARRNLWVPHGSAARHD